MGGRRAGRGNGRSGPGGPNGLLSLTQARKEYALYIAESDDPDSMHRGGEGTCWSAAKRALTEHGEDVPPDLA